MPTTFYFQDDAANVTLSGYSHNVKKAVIGSRGSGVVTKTQDTVQTADGNGIEIRDSDATSQIVWACQVNGYSQGTGTCTANFWGRESNAMANYTAAFGRATSGGGGGTADLDSAILVYDSAGNYRFDILTTPTESGTEWGTSADVRNWTTGACTSRTINDGDWLVFVPAHNVFGASSNSGYTLDFNYNGTTASANGDTYVILPDTITAYTGGVTTARGYAQSQAQIKALNVKGYAQSQAQIKTTARNYAQAQTRIRRIDAYSSIILSDTPIAYWRMDEASGLPFDSSGNNHHSDASNGSFTYSQTGIVNNNAAISFSSIASRFRVPNHTDFNLGNGPFTIEFWVKRTSIDAADWFIGSWNSDWTVIGVTITGQLGTWGGSGGSSGSWFTSTEQLLNDTNWHHVVITKNGSSRIAYIDNISLTNQALDYTLSNPTIDFYLGAGTNTDDGFVGLLDEAAVYNYVLSATQVSNHYFNAKGLFPRHAQAQATILVGGVTTSYAYAQAQAQIRGTYWNFAQAQASINKVYKGYAQTQALVYIPIYYSPTADISNNGWVRTIST